MNKTVHRLLYLDLLYSNFIPNFVNIDNIEIQVLTDCVELNSLHNQQRKNHIYIVLFCRTNILFRI